MEDIVKLKKGQTFDNLSCYIFQGTKNIQLYALKKIADKAIESSAFL